jgi:threonine/homoserine/homoserine lactone efflux protein
VIFVTILPRSTQPGDSPLRLALMLLAFEIVLVTWLDLYGALVSRAGRSRATGQVPWALDRITGRVLIGLGL